VPEPLATLASFPVSYEARLSDQGLAPWSRTESYRDDRPPELEILTWRLELDAERALGLVDAERGWAQGHVVGEDALERLLHVLGADRAVTLETLPRVLVRTGGRAHLENVSERAFLREYVARNDGHAIGGIVADPVVDVARDGLRFALEVGVPHGKELPLALQWESSIPQGGLVEGHGKLPGMDLPLTVHLPLHARKTISGQTSVEAGQALVVGPVPHGDGRRAEVLVLWLRSLAPELAQGPPVPPR